MGKLKTALKLLRGDPSKFKKTLSDKFAKSKFSHIFPDKMFLKMRYKTFFGKKPNLTNPQTFNEKLLWLKLYDRNPKYTDLVDKYEVKKYIAETIGEEYIIPTLGIYNRFEDIDFDILPQKFVIKCTHDSGSVVICQNKDSFDVAAAEKKITPKLKFNMFWWGREWPYKNVKPRIIIEQYMEDDETSELRDYKFFCFNGTVKALFVATDRQKEGEEVKFDFFDPEYNHLPFKQGHPNAKTLPQKPHRLKEMIQLAEKLSVGFPQLRVDFYEVNGEIYFGELTFSHFCGMVPFEPAQWDDTFGSWIKLPKKR